MSLMGEIGDFFRNFIEDFKESTRLFKIKVGLVGGYVVICLATVIVFIPPDDTNQIDSAIRVREADSLVGGRFLKIHNQSSDVWRKVKLTLNERYKANWVKIRAGKSRTIFLNRFVDDRGNKPDAGLRKIKLRIDCNEGVSETCYRLFKNSEAEKVRCGNLKFE